MKTTTTGYRGGRPMALSTRGVVSSGHYVATGIGIDILRRGGNAFDAAAAVGFALTVLQPHQNGIAGEAPMLLYHADSKRVWALSGHGGAPALATLEYFQGEGMQVIPGDGLLPAITPPAVASWIFLLREFGTMRLADVLTPAVELAENGIPVYDALHSAIAGCAERFRTEWPSSAEVFLHDGEAPQPLTVLNLPRWAETFREMLKCEAKYSQREDGLRAAHDYFYRGPVAEKIDSFCRHTEIADASGASHRGLLRAEDLAAYEARLEYPLSTFFRGLEICKCPPWSQGPVLLQTLRLIDEMDLMFVGINSVEYIHLVVECIKLAYADREFYYGDPDFVDVPLKKLLSYDYARERAKLVDPEHASTQLRPGGLPPVEVSSIVDVNAHLQQHSPDHGDTTKLEVIDSAGNMISATPSGGWLQSSPVIPDTGFPLGTRGQMFSLVPEHPNVIAPGKRPRTTLTPTLALRDRHPYMVFGSPGGDNQDQWALQFLLNVVLFELPLQRAIEAPTFWSTHFPSSFYPRTAEPAAVHAETGIDPFDFPILRDLGHEMIAERPWAGGNTLAAAIDPKTGTLCAAASPRLEPACAGAL